MRIRGLAALVLVALLGVGLWFVLRWIAEAPRAERVRPSTSTQGPAPSERGVDPSTLRPESVDGSSTEEGPLEEPGLFPPPSEAQLAALIAEIADPSDAANHTSTSIGLRDNSIHVKLRPYWRAARAVAELGAGPPSSDVDEALLAIARDHEAWDARCRATRALLLRGHPQAAKFAVDLTRDEAPHTRYVAWRICVRACQGRQASLPITAEGVLEQHAAETNLNVARQIEVYLGTIRAREAIPMLMERLRTGDPARRGNAALTLGCIGAKEAVHLLIALSRQANRKSYLVALGRIGSPQAVQYLVDNLREPGAAEALVAAGDKSVVPALESALAEMRARSEGDRDRLREQELELAILQLKPDDSSSALLEVLEDRRNDTELRASAAALLRQRRMIEGNLVQEARLAAIYLAEEDHEVREQCASALENSRARGVTAAMLRHAVSWNADPTRKTSGPAWLLWCLNRRLGTSFQTLDDVKRYVEETGSPK